MASPFANRNAGSLRRSRERERETKGNSPVNARGALCLAADIRMRAVRYDCDGPQWVVVGLVALGNRLCYMHGNGRVDNMETTLSEPGEAA